jgi:hypothetical protein
VLTDNFELNPSLSFALLGTFAVYLWTRPSRKSVFAVLVLAAIMREACLWREGGFGAYFGVWLISWGAFLGIASLVVLAFEIAGARGARHNFLLRTFYGGAVFPLLGLAATYLLALTVWLRPTTYDAFLLAFDATVGFQPSFLLGNLLLKSPLAWQWTTVVYYALPLSVMLLYGSYRVQKKQPVAILQLFLSFLVAGMLLYNLYPAVGPGHAFGGIYPGHPPAISQIPLVPIPESSSPRNCMPSLHFGAALLVFWNSRIWSRWARLASGAFLVLMAVATLGLGEHYLADLIVAFPFCLFFQAAWTTGQPLRTKQRTLAAFFCFAMTAVWYFVLRYGILIFVRLPGVSSALALSTIVVTSFLENKLSNAVWARV